jgi:hypothetical protein
MKFVEDKAESGDAASTATASQQIAQGKVIEDPQNFRLCDRLSQLPDRHNRSKVKQGSLYSRTWNTGDGGAVHRSKGAIAMCLDSHGAASATIRRGDVDNSPIVTPEIPKVGSRSMREDCLRSTGEHGRLKTALSCERRMTGCKDTIVDLMQSSSRNSAMSNRAVYAQRLQLPKRNHAMLSGGQPSYLSVPISMPTGRNVTYGMTFRPVGGGLGGYALHALRMRGRSARVVR